MIAAFGIAYEPEPGLLEIPDIAVRGVHITRLTANGSGKAGTERDKIMIGSSIGYPIVLAPPNDLGCLAIAKGIEDALSIHDDTGLGVWAAGSASRLPSLADVVPRYIEAVTITVDDDDIGRANQCARRALARARRSRGAPSTHRQNNKGRSMTKQPDANEIHRTQGPDALRQAIDDAVPFTPKVKRGDERTVRRQRGNGQTAQDDDRPFGEIRTAPPALARSKADYGFDSGRGAG
jgi:hypothetical protein